MAIQGHKSFALKNYFHKIGLSLTDGPFPFACKSIKPAVKISQLLVTSSQSTALKIIRISMAAKAKSTGTSRSSTDGRSS